MYDKIKKRVFDIMNPRNSDNIVGKIFDIFIFSLIVLNTTMVIIDTFEIPDSFRRFSTVFETVSVLIFTFEYFLRLWTSDIYYQNKGPLVSRIKFIFSFLAIIDLLAILPFYLPFWLPIDLRVLRTLRMIRVFRIFKVGRYSKSINVIGKVFKSKAHQLISLMFVVSILIIIASVIMYNVENEAQPEVFDNAFSGIWWAVATLTTVGYGDIYPITVVGRFIGAVIAFPGIGLVAVPTGIISAGFMENVDKEKTEEECEKQYCPYCGKRI